MSRLEYLLKQYENVLDWYRQSEDKAKFLVTINTLVVGVVNGLVFVGADKFRTVRPIYTTPIWVLLCLSGIALVGSYLFILRAMWPRHHTRDNSTKNSTRIWFFGDIASMSREDHRAAVVEWSEQNFEEALTAQSHILSTNVWTKHEALNRAIALTIVALILLFGLGVAYGIAIASTPI
jgi:hypothetical protein